MKRSLLVLALVLAGGVVACGPFHPIPATADAVSPAPSDSPSPDPTPMPSPTADPCGQLSQGYTHECVPEPSPVAIGAEQGPPQPATADSTPGAQPAPPTVAPSPVPPTLRVTASSWCSQCPVAAQMVVTVRDVSAGGSAVAGACGTVTVRWQPNSRNVPVGTVETFQGCTAGARPSLDVTLAQPWSASGTTGGGAILLKLDFSYQGGRVVSCSNPCP